MQGKKQNAAQKESAMYNDFKIYKVKREFREFGFDIWAYYWHMVERWNKYVDTIEKLPDDGRTVEYKAMDNFYTFIMSMCDMINQTENAHRAEVDALKAELRKWTENRGRKPLLTKSDCAKIKLLRADGESCRKLARKFGVSERTIRRALESERAHLYTP